MGSIHKGHISLVQKSILENDYTICSIYVNPTQFNDRTDFIKYPREEEKDIKILHEFNCNAVFLPNDKEMYPKRDEVLKDNFIKGVISVGIDVVDMGVLPTPVNYFSLFSTDIKNSVQITGSHNPAEYNGFKISFNKKPFYGKDIQILKDIIVNEKFQTLNKIGIYTKINILDKYIKYICNNIKINKPYKIALDCGNAAGCLVAPYLFKNLGIESIPKFIH